MEMVRHREEAPTEKLPRASRLVYGRPRQPHDSAAGLSLRMSRKTEARVVSANWVSSPPSMAATWDFDGQPGHGVVDLPSQSICEGWMLLGSVWQLETKLSIRRNRDET